MAGRDRTGIDDVRPTFDLYRKMLDSPHIGSARRRATRWALDELERRMGADWLERYWEKCGHVPPEVNLGGAHVSALGKLLDFALRFAVLDGLPGVGKVQKEMKNDVRDERRQHCALQLEVGALAARAGCSVTFENRPQPAAPPSDVVLRRERQVIRTETFAIMPDQQTRDGDVFWRRISQMIMRLRMKHDTPVSGTIAGVIDDQDTVELFRLVEDAARRAAETGRDQPVSSKQAELLVHPPGSSGHRLEFSAPAAGPGLAWSANCWRKPSRPRDQGAVGSAPTSSTALGSSRTGHKQTCTPRSTR
jgi:hypothetical protein